MAQYSPKLPKIVHISHNGTEWPKMAQNGPKRYKMAQTGPKWPEMTQNELIGPIIVQKGSK